MQEVTDPDGWQDGGGWLSRSWLWPWLLRQQASWRNGLVQERTQTHMVSPILLVYVMFVAVMWSESSARIQTKYRRAFMLYTPAICYTKDAVCSARSVVAELVEG